MKKSQAILTLLLLLAVIGSPSPHQAQAELEDVDFNIRMAVTYLNKGTRIWNLTKDQQSFSLFMNNTWQRVQLVNHSYPLATAENDTDGNPVAILQFPTQQLKPGENLSYTVTYHVLSRPRTLPNISEEDSQTLHEIPDDLKEEYTAAEGPWLTKDPELEALAHRIVGNETTVLTIVKDLAAWVANQSNIKYKIHEVPLYPNETVKNKEGDCDDKAILLITLARICGIPSYLQIGCIYTPATPISNDTYWQGHATFVSRRISWHGWAIVYIPPWGWLPVDLTYVLGDTADPLNRIRKAAVTWQWVIQCMNFTKGDYVASSRDARDFLQQNGFYIYEDDEMWLSQAIDTEWPWGTKLLTPVFVAGAIGGATAVLVAVGSIYFWRRRKKKWN